MELFSDPERIRGDLQLLNAAIRRKWPVTTALMQRAIDVVEELLESNDEEIKLSAVKTLAILAKQNLQREITALAMLAREQEAEATIVEGKSHNKTTIVVVEDAGWFGNNAHDKTTETPRLSSPDASKPGTI